MPKMCELTGKKVSVGHNVSHSNRKTKRTFKPNVSKKTVIDPVTGAKLKINISTRAQRTLVKNPSKFRAELAALVKKQAAKRAPKKAVKK
jgi:large subunit ribosomal protein L28